MAGIVGIDAHPPGGDVEQMLGPAGAIGGAAAGLALALDQVTRPTPCAQQVSAWKVPDAPAPITATWPAVTRSRTRSAASSVDLVGEAEAVEDPRGLVADQQHRPVQPALVLADAVLARHVGEPARAGQQAERAAGQPDDLAIADLAAAAAPASSRPRGRAGSRPARRGASATGSRSGTWAAGSAPRRSRRAGPDLRRNGRRDGAAP